MRRLSVVVAAALIAVGSAVAVGVAAPAARADTQICSQVRIDVHPGRQVHRPEQCLGRRHHPVHQRDEHRVRGHLGRAQPAAERRPRRVPVDLRRMPLRQLQLRQRPAAAGQRQPVRHDLDQRQHEYPNNGSVYDAAYDIWFDPTARTDGQNTGAELMVWLNHTGSVQPPARRSERSPSPAPTGTSGTATTAGTSSPTSGRARPRRSASPSRLLPRHGQPRIRAELLVHHQRAGRLRALGQRHRPRRQQLLLQHRYRHQRPAGRRPADRRPAVRPLHRRAQHLARPTAPGCSCGTATATPTSVHLHLEQAAMVYGNKCLDASARAPPTAPRDHLGLQRPGQPAVERQLQRHHQRRAVGAVPRRQRRGTGQRHPLQSCGPATARATSDSASADRTVPRRRPRGSLRGTCRNDPLGGVRSSGGGGGARVYWASLPASAQLPCRDLGQHRRQRRRGAVDQSYRPGGISTSAISGMNAAAGTTAYPAPRSASCTTTPSSTPPATPRARLHRQRQPARALPQPRPRPRRARAPTRAGWSRGS